MKIFTSKLLLFFVLLFFSLVLSLCKTGIKIQSKIQSKNCFKKMKNKARRLKIKLRNQRKKSKLLLLKLQQIQNGDDKYSSFLEMKSDPVFKTMTFGFPIPRSTSYTGLAGAASNFLLK